jgi:aspartate kinase
MRVVLIFVRYFFDLFPLLLLVIPHMISLLCKGGFLVLYTHCSLARKKIMALIVSKFGGTSVASPERIKNVAKRLIAMKQQGNDVVAVVSKTTDELVGLAAALNDHPSKREMDMLLSTGEQVSMSLLAMAIQALGYNSVSFTGWQAGITTDNDFSSAKIEGIDADKIRKALSTGAIVVVAGFQGVSENGDITTLGRGGSDTTAVALAYGINADVCEIYSDVEGIYTADPRVAPRARKLSCISYDDMLELSSGGAGVLQARAVEFARKYKVVIHSRSAFSDEEGTLIKEVVPSMEQAVISGIAHDTSEMKITLRGLPDELGIAARVFSILASSDVRSI